MSTAQEAGRDAAWVVVQTRLCAPELGAFCADLERLCRINPYLEVHSWESLAHERYRVDITNHSNGRRAVLELALTRTSPLLARVAYSTGIKRATSFEIRGEPGGSSLTITEDYAADAQSGAPAAEVDRSLHAWGVALQDYIDSERRWGWIPFRDTWRRRLWLPMKPAARRIAWLIAVVTMAEFVFFLLVVTVYWIEQQR